MSATRNLAELAADANIDGADAVGNVATTDLIQKQHLTAELLGYAASGHNHDGTYLPVNSGLNALADTATASPQADQVLQFNGTNWVPADLSLGDGTVTPTTSGSSVTTHYVQTFATTQYALGSLIGDVQISELNLAITPQSLTSKLMITAHVCGGHDAQYDNLVINLTRNGARVQQPSALELGARMFGHASFGVALGDQGSTMSGHFTLQDEPASVAQVTYGISIYDYQNSQFYLNRTGSDTNNGNGTQRMISTLSIIEYT